MAFFVLGTAFEPGTGATAIGQAMAVSDP